MRNSSTKWDDVVKQPATKINNREIGVNARAKKKAASVPAVVTVGLAGGPAGVGFFALVGDFASPRFDALF